MCKISSQLRLIALIVLMGCGWSTGACGEQSAVSVNAQEGWVAEILQGPSEVPEGGHLWLFLVLIAVATLVTEDLTCVSTGVLIANGTLTNVQGIGACLFGILVGDFLLYFAGRKLGRPALKRIPLRWMIDPVKLSKSEAWFKKRGGVTILISRFIPGSRLPAYVSAGILGVPYVKFLSFFVVAALLWTPGLIWLSQKMARKALLWIEEYHQATPYILLGLLLTYVVVLKILVPAMRWQGRRQLLGKWRRLTRPEYWPTKVLYFPVFFMLLFRWFRPGKHPLDFSACNPCMPGAGVVEESKADILSQIKDPDAVARFCLLSEAVSLAEQMAEVKAFMQRAGLEYPVVVKPDVGQRGAQVVIAKCESEVREALERIKQRAMVQAYVPGLEYGVFYIRYPAHATGKIFAITKKSFGEVVGDGVHNLERLILADPRAVCQADIHMKTFQARLLEVPEAGLRIPLTDVGNHCRGTLFEEGMWLYTSALEARVDEISQSLPGFYFGRYDIMAPDEDAFRQGRDLKVIELNGVSSEATSMYDPSYSCFYMMGRLLKQWGIASEIGRSLQQQGQARMFFKTLIHDYDSHLRRQHQAD